MKTAIILALAILFCAAVSYYPPVIAQVPSISTSLTDLINPKYDDYVRVVAETPHTLILVMSTGNFIPAAEALDIVKQNGFKIDSITEFIPAEGPVLPDIPQLYTVFFSK